MAKRDLSGQVDFSVLKPFAALDPTVVEEVLDLFSQQAALWRDMLNPSHAGWRDVAHTLKGAARGIGAHVLGEACDRAEASPEDMAAPALTQVLDALDVALSDVAAYRHQHLLDSLKR